MNVVTVPPWELDPSFGGNLSCWNEWRWHCMAVKWTGRLSRADLIYVGLLSLALAFSLILTYRTCCVSLLLFASCLSFLTFKTLGFMYQTNSSQHLVSWPQVSEMNTAKMTCSNVKHLRFVDVHRVLSASPQMPRLTKAHWAHSTASAEEEVTLTHVHVHTCCQQAVSPIYVTR